MRVVTFLKALWWHIWLGFPASSQAQIDHRFSICSSCEMYDAKNTQCLVCGCFINNKRIFLNKLAWADQECPNGKWGALVKGIKNDKNH